MNKIYSLFKVHIDKKSALQQIEKVFDSGFINEGAQVAEFERLLLPWFENKQYVLLNSCTSALYLALELSGVQPGDEVISISQTCVATNSNIPHFGAKIVWADIKKETANIDVDDIEKKITNKTKAIIFVNWAGIPADLQAIYKLQYKYPHIKTIQDAAHSFGAKFNDVPICNWADFSTYSMQAIKFFSSGGDGGILFCKSHLNYEEAKSLKWFGLDREKTKDINGNWLGNQWEPDIKRIGHKFNLNNLAAAVGISQISHISNILYKHKENAKTYHKLFEYCPYAKPLLIPEGAEPIHWVYTILLRNDLDRNLIMNKLNEEGIKAGVVHIPNHHYTCFKEFYSELPETDYFAAHQFSLPVGWWLEKEDIEYIFNKFIEICEKNK